LAAVISLVNRDPQFIVDMMLDKGDTVTVRLFEVSIGKDNKQSFKAKYFNVDKSIPKHPNGKDAYTKEHLWVQVLEKAYAAAGFVGSTKKLEEQLKSNNHQGYEDIESGYMAFAYQILTGKPAEKLTFTIKISSNKDYAVTNVPVDQRGQLEGNKKYDFQYLPWGTYEKKLFKAAGPNYSRTVSYAIFNKNKTNMLKWWKFVKKGSIDKLFAREFIADDYSGQVTLEDLDLIFQGKMKDQNGDEVKGLPVLDKKIATSMLDWLKAKQLYSGKRGSGIYSVLQLNMFKTITEALTNNKLVGLSTKEKVGLKTDGKGHSAGESIARGLVGNHAYSVLTTRENPPTKELELKNPWGHTVKKNITVGDFIIDLTAKIQKIINLEISNLSPIYQKLELDHMIMTGDYEDEIDETKKAELKKAVDIAFKELDAIKQKIIALQTPDKIADFMGKITNKNAASYDKKILILNKLKKEDPTKMISKTVSQSNEAGHGSGEFWLLLDDLTKRFKTIHIG